MIQIGSSNADPAKSCRFDRTRIRNTAFHESVVLLQKHLFYGTSPLDGNKGLIRAGIVCQIEIYGMWIGVGTHGLRTRGS